MKKSLLLFGLAGLFFITSCSKKGCQTCSLLTIKYEICEDEVTTSVNGIKTGTTPLNGVSVEDYAADLESAGYSCK